MSRATKESQAESLESVHNLTEILFLGDREIFLSWENIVGDSIMCVRHYCHCPRIWQSWFGVEEFLLCEVGGMNEKLSLC